MVTTMAANIYADLREGLGCPNGIWRDLINLPLRSCW
jgi:hypothetical protein